LIILNIIITFEATKRAGNSWKLSMGLFRPDESNGNSFNQFLQVVSRHTWQQPMTMIGYEYSTFCNNYGRVDVEYFHGATVVFDANMSSAVSLGGFIIINPGFGGANYDNADLLHEYGHFLQTRMWGGLAFIPAAISSVMSGMGFRSTLTHDEIWVEQDANARAMGYFGNRLSTGQREKFDDVHPNQKYYDGRFFRYWFFPDLITLNILDLIWSD